MHVHGEGHEYRLKKSSARVINERAHLHGNNGKTANVADKHYIHMRNRFYEENAEAWEECKKERAEIAKKRQRNNVLQATGVGLNWSNLQDLKCPFCSLPLEDNDKGLMVCISHPGRDFIIRKDKLKALNEKHSKKKKAE